MLSSELFLTLARLFLLTGLGFAIFRGPILQDKILPFLLKLLLWVGFPMYSVSRIGTGWDQALEQGWVGMLAFFLLGCGMIGLQFLMGRALIRRFRPMKTDYPREILILFGLHNAGYLPLPIFNVLLPDWMMVYVFYYIVAFNLLFWTFSIPLLERGSPRLTIRITPPLTGILFGIFLAASGLYGKLPEFLRAFMGRGGEIALDLILLLLGGTLAPIRFAGWKDLKELRWMALFRMLIYPLVASIVCLVLTRIVDLGLDAAAMASLGLFVVIEAAMPPATNTMVVVRAYGDARQTEVIGGGMLICYAVSLVTLPLFLISVLALF